MLGLSELGPREMISCSSSGIGGAVESGLQGDQAFEVQGGERLIEGLHAVLRLPGLHHAVDLVHLVLADEVADGGVGNEDLHRERPPLAGGAGQERLAENALEHEGQLHPYLALLMGREDVDDAVDRLRGGVGVQGGEGQVAGLGDAQRRLDGLEVAHLADQHDIGVLTQAGPQGVGEAMGVGVELALVDDALLVAVEILDRVLDRDDVLGALTVHLVQHGGERRRLAGAGGAGDEHQSARFLADLLDDRRQTELAEAADLVRNLPESGGDRAALVEDVGAEAGQPLDAEGEVELEVLLQAVFLVVGEDRVGDLLGLGRRERRNVERLEHAIDAHLGRRVGRDVQIRPPLLDHRLQHLIQGRRHGLLRKSSATRNVTRECTRRFAPPPQRAPHCK